MIIIYILATTMIVDCKDSKANKLFYKNCCTHIFRLKKSKVNQEMTTVCEM